MPYKDPQTKRTHQKEVYEQRKEKYLKRNQLRRKHRRDWVAGLLNCLSCINCGEAHNECLDFHHVDAAEKEHSVSGLVTNMATFTRLIDEIERCVVLCSNCHRRYHRGTITLPEMKTITVPEYLKSLASELVGMARFERATSALPERHST